MKQNITIKCKIGDLFKAIENFTEEKIVANHFTKIDDLNIYIKNENNDFTKINSLMIKEGKESVVLLENDIKIKCSNTHRFYYENENSFITLDELKEGDSLFLYNKEKLKIKEIQKTNKTSIFYDLSVDSESQLYITTNGIVHHNCGKSEMISNLADYYGQTVIRINFSTGITPSDLIGRFVVKNGETVFAYGFIPLAMEKGYWILLDEIDYAQPEHLSCLQAVLEGNPLVLTQSEGEIIHPHAEFRLFATANTKGRGDTSESYSGTSFLNMAFLDRWSMFEMDYSKKEKNILLNLIEDSELVSKTIDMFGLFRKALKGGDISNAVFSTRRMIMFIEALKMGDSVEDALTYEILNRYHEDESAMLLEYAKDIFDYTHYFKGNWKCGMPHHVPQATVQSNVTSAGV